MQVYAFHLANGDWVFYAPPPPMKPPLEETAPSDFKGVVLRRLRRTYAEAWTLMQESPKRIWVWTRAILRRLERLIHPYESLLRTLNEDADITIVHPENADPDEVRRHWEALLRRRLAVHRRGIILNVCLLPVTSAAMLLPGPNVFIAWNALRLYGHLTARRGARRALEASPSACAPDARLPNELPAAMGVTPHEIETLAQNLALDELPEHFRRLNASS
jgi:hypothetical protein